MTRPFAVLLGAGLVAAAFSFPADRFDRTKAERLAQREAEVAAEARLHTPDDDSYVDTINRPAPISGSRLFQILLLVDAAVVLGIAWAHRRAEGPATSGPAIAATGAPAHSWQRPEVVAIGVITALGAASRLVGAEQDLWLDEVVTLLRYARAPIADIVLAANSANNHLLNSILCHFSIRLFGENELSLRLPAILFGVASIPVLYALVRLRAGSRESLLAAVLLALSYHHVTFSQNARGYSAFLFGALLGTYALVRAFDTPRARFWVLYVIGSTIAILSQLLAAFVLVGHALALALSWRPQADRRPFKAAVWALAASVLLAAHAYALVVPDLLGVLFGEYREPATGWRLSRELLAVVWEGLALGPATLAVATLGGGVFLWGAASCWKQDRRFTGLLAWPPMVTLVFFVAMGAGLTPRYLIIALPACVVFGSRGVFLAIDAASSALARGPARRRLSLALTCLTFVAAVAGSGLMLTRNYRLPKQDYRGARRFLEPQLREGDVVVAVGTAGEGYRYYWPAATVVNRVSHLEDLRASARRVWVLWAFERDMTLRRPRLLAYVGRSFEELGRFPGTVGGGDIHVCRSR